MSKRVLNFGPRFVHRDMKSDPSFDMQEVDQFGFIDLNESFEKGIIPGSVDLTDEDFNGCVNPGTLISRSMDVFDGLRKRDYVSRTLSNLSAEEREKVENAMKRQSEKEGVVHQSVTPEE